MSPISHVLYLHGFRSSPLSAKARFLAAWFQHHHPQVVWSCPQLPASPKTSAELISHLVQDWPAQSLLVVGSSLGGFYATWLAGQKACRALLLNPAVHPARDLAAYIGEHPVWQQPEDQIFFLPAYIDELKAMYLGAELSCLGLPDAANILALIATGDEVLDWREMAARYAHAQQHIVQGSDHGLSDFAHHWNQLRFNYRFI